MKLFTFLLEYDQGSYVSQIESDSFRNASICWANELEIDSIYGLGPASKKEIIQQMNDEDNNPIQIENTINAWCSDFVVRGKLGIVTIVKTDQA